MRASYLLLLSFLGANLLFAQSAPPPGAAAGTPPPPLTQAQSQAAAEVKSYCDQIDDYKKESAPQLFADASDQPKPAWRRVASEREIESLNDALFQHSTTARAWLKGKNVVAVDTEASGGTADWLLAAEYCFRPDGTLAAIHSEFRNEKDDYIAVRDESFTPDGKSLGENPQVLDLHSRRPRKISKQVASAEIRTVLYHTTKELPFYKLVSFK
jgi:hypothetical protein